MNKYQSLTSIEEELNQLPVELLNPRLQALEQDTRKGARKLIKKHLKRIQRAKEEKERMETLLTFEKKYLLENVYPIAGIDEAGRGPLAGPVVAAAVVLPEKFNLPGLDDSKKLSAKAREILYLEIQEQALDIGIGIVDPQTIDDINILQATIQAMTKAVNQLQTPPKVLLIDALLLPKLPMKQEKIIQGDQHSASIAAASIIAKVTRDHLMNQWDQLYPEYGFSKHKGYGTKQHIEAIHTYGLSPIHRRSFQIPK